MGTINEANMQAQPGKRLAAEPPKKGGTALKISLAIAVAAVVVFYGVCCYMAHTGTVFFPHTYLNGVEVSGLTAAEAAQTVTDRVLSRDLRLFTTEDGLPFADIPFAELLEDVPIDPAAVAAAYDAQHSGLLSGGWQYLCRLFTADGTYLPFQWDEAGVDAWMDTVAAQLYRAPQDTDARVEHGQLVVTVAQDGRKADIDALRAALTEDLSVTDAAAGINLGVDTVVIPAKVLTARALHDRLHGEMQNAAYDAATDTIIPERLGADFDVSAAQAAMDAAAPGATITLEADIREPEVTAAELEAVLFRDVLGEAKTKVGGTVARKSNVKLSAASINGLVLNHGDIFSYNESVGQRTAANGYQAAPAYVKGETVDEIGGGICQTSSTLYLACLRGDLEITERYAHRYIPSYIAAGMDATVSWGGPDYKFTNDTLYPIRIVTEYEKDYLTVKLLGTNVTGVSAKMTNEKLSSTDFEVVYEESAEQAPGTQKVKTTPYTGSKWRTYRHVYDADGKLISSAYEATSDYKARNKVILVAPGELPGTPASAPAEVPAVSDVPLPEEPTSEEPTPAEPEPPIEPEEPPVTVVPSEEAFA